MDQVKSNEELVRRWTQMFKFYDVNENGRLSRSDFDILQENIMKKNALTADKKKEVMKLSADFWERYFGKDTADSVMELDEYLGIMSDIYKSGKMSTYNREYRTRIFYCMDLDGDDKINLEEFLIFAGCLGKSDEAFMEKAFKAIDADNDGSISLGEYVNAYIGFFNDVEFDTVNCPLYG